MLGPEERRGARVPQAGSSVRIWHRQAGELSSDKAPGEDPCPSSLLSQPQVPVQIP